ncbi:hypothetical protein [Chroococcidiopsis sp.]|uniref:hypothetical protein n=1 Tax=Chroococcidiopsis sp. TaxID=3088168 RepID=UPI003F3590B5
MNDGELTVLKDGTYQIETRQGKVVLGSVDAVRIACELLKTAHAKAQIGGKNYDKLKVIIDEEF